MKRSTFIIALLFCFTSTLHADNVPLVKAKALAESTFKDFKYSTDPKVKNATDCTRFLLAVVEEVNGKPLDKAVRQRILMSDLPAPLDAKLITDEDSRTKGVQQALVTAKLGTVVDPKDVQIGDLIQYWMQKADGTWFGHSAVIEEVFKSKDDVKVSLFGAHASIGKIGTSSAKLTVSPGDAKRKIYIVRYGAP